jgi:hypothetical protein
MLEHEICKSVKDVKSIVGVSIREFPPRPWASRVDHTVYLDELMKLFQIHAPLSIVENITELASLTNNLPEYRDKPLEEADIEAALERIEKVGKLCADFGFRSLFCEVERNRESVKDGCSYAELGRIAENLRNRIQDEFKDVLLLWIEDAKYYRQDELFGDKVAKRFRKASFDIEESGTCFALNRHTACVYHLMRVAEWGLKAIAERVGYPDPRPRWEAVLTYIDSQLNKNRDEISALFKGDIEFIAGISTHMHAVNLAWRRRVAHVERTYIEEEALQIMTATKILMQHLSEKLSESEDEESVEND